MDRIKQILCHPRFIAYMNKNADMELDRIFCKHNLEHVLEVARIAAAFIKEESLTPALRETYNEEELLYAAALLHDIGRHIQYETGEKHGPVSARLAPEILCDCGYLEAEIDIIADAIFSHSDKSLVDEKSLRGILAKADLYSRNCGECKVRDLCNWSEEEKNHPML